MIRIAHLILSLDDSSGESLRREAARTLGVSQDEIAEVQLRKRSIDARGRGGVRFSCIVDVAVLGDEAVVVRDAERRGVRGIVPAPDETYRELEEIGVAAGAGPASSDRPVIIGAGPCGLIAALILARAGRNPIVLERGKKAGDRARDVTGFWRRGWAFNPESNVQFGEGGAGTFSDGKLYTQIRDREHRIPWILRELAAAGAPDDILTSGKPHIGTDRLIRVVRHIREQIEAVGGEVRFESKVTRVFVEGGRVAGVEVNGGESIAAATVVVAVGHSARDTFEVLREAGVAFERKPISIGVRIEHPQAAIDRAQFGRFAGHPALGAAAYKAVFHTRPGRPVYSFCMCPGGLVVAASSEPGGVVTNGMSSYARAEANANSGLMAEVRVDDYGDDDPFAGIAFQRHWERRAFEVGGADYRAPVQTVGDFLAGRPAASLGSVGSSYLPGVTPADLRDCLPEFAVRALKEAIPQIDRKLRGFAMPDAVLVGIETRSSSPVRMPRNPDTLESITVRGLIPAGEGAGYAGGIISAAVDGMRAAEMLLRR